MLQMVWRCVRKVYGKILLLGGKILLLGGKVVYKRNMFRAQMLE